MKTERQGFHTLAALPAFAVFILLFLLPVGTVLSKASLKAVLGNLSDPYMLSVMGFTLRQALSSTVISLVLGLPGAWLVGRRSFKGKNILTAVYSIPFVLPSILAVLGFVIFYGNNGILNRILGTSLHIMYSYKAVLLAHAFYNFPVIVMTVGNYWATLNGRLEDASGLLGGGHVRTFFKITLPRLLPAVASACSLVFLYCFTSFAIILVLGGGPSTTTAEVEIYRLAKTSLDTEGAASLAIFSLAVACIVLALHAWFEKSSSKGGETFTDQVEKKLSPLGDVLAILYGTLSVLFVMCPIASIVARSFMEGSSRASGAVFTLSAWKNLFSDVPSAARAMSTGCLRAFFSATLSTVCAITVCAFLKRRRSIFLSVLLMLPMAVSSVITGLGYHIMGSHLRSISGEFLLTLAHCALTMPFAIRSMLPSCRRIPDNLIQASETLGLSEVATFFQIELPLMSRPALTAFAFCFTLSLGEVNATLMLGGTKASSVAVLIYRLVSSYNYQTACVLGTLLVIICFAAFMLARTLKGSENA